MNALEGGVAHGQAAAKRLCEDQPEERREREGEPLMQSLRLLSLAVHRGAGIAEWAVEDKVGSRVLREIGKAEMGGRLGSQSGVRQPEIVAFLEARTSGFAYGESVLYY